VNSTGKGIAVASAVALVLAFAVAAMPSETGEHYYLQIMLPGFITGAMIGFFTQRYGAPAKQS
jgi:flagellar biosynthesis protein FliR